MCLYVFVCVSMPVFESLCLYVFLCMFVSLSLQFVQMPTSFCSPNLSPNTHGVPLLWVVYACACVGVHTAPSPTDNRPCLGGTADQHLFWGIQLCPMGHVLSGAC